MKALTFHATQFDVIDRNGQPWLRGFQIGRALGYADASSVNRIFARNADEFTELMTGSVKLTDPNGDLQETRIFSLRGAHLLAMFARTKVAKEFRAWALDALEGMTEAPRAPASQTLLGTTIGTDGFHCLAALLDGKVRHLPAPERKRAKMHVWSQVHKAFSVVSGEHIPSEQLDSARNFIAAYNVREGEFIEAEKPKNDCRLDIHWPAQRLIDETPSEKVRDRMTFLQGKGNIMLTPDMLYGPDRATPTLDVLRVLQQNGYNVEACRLEVLAMMHHLESAQYTFSCIQALYQSTEGKGIRFKMGADRPTRI